MLCPRDRTALDASSVDGASIHSCKKCKGLWLDREPLKVLTDSDSETLVRRVRAASTGAPPIYCPREGMSLSVVRLGGVEIDVCRSCYGVWLDKRELEKIKAALTDSPVDDLIDRLLDTRGDTKAEGDKRPGTFRDTEDEGDLFNRIWEWIEDLDID